MTKRSQYLTPSVKKASKEMRDRVALQWKRLRRLRRSQATPESFMMYEEGFMMGLHVQLHESCKALWLLELEKDKWKDLYNDFK